MTEKEFKHELWLLDSKLILKTHEVKCLDTLKEVQKAKIAIYEQALNLAIRYIEKTNGKGTHKIINYLHQITKGQNGN
jgi:hypothetical protein